MQAGFLNEKLVFSPLEAASSVEAIQKVGQKLVEVGYIKPEYIDAVLEREGNFPTGLGLQGMAIAIPHATPEDMVLKNGIAVARLTQPVTFHAMEDPDETVEAEMIFMLALKDPNEHMGVLGAMFTTFQNIEILEELKKAPDSKEIFAILEANFQ